MKKREAIFTKDMANNKMTMVRIFDASLEKVWNAWTQPVLLDQWWAPKPYHARTKTMDFREGGFWLYCMEGPTNDKTWCKENYQSIVLLQKIINSVHFCDEQGLENTDTPVMHWNKNFSGNDNETTITVEITFDSPSDMENIIQMGFQLGFTMGLNNLEELLAEGANL